MHNAHNYDNSSDIGNNIPNGAIVWVRKAATLNGGTYAHVVYNGIEGIASKNFLDLVPSYTLSFNANGGSGGPGSVRVWANVSDYYIVSVPYRENYTFNGWYTASSGGTRVYDANGYCTNEGSWWRNNVYVGGTSATLYAQWTINTIYVEGVTLNHDYVELTQGDTIQLSADVQPANATNRAVSWVSGDTSIATVSPSGVVTAVGLGSAVISASAQDGSGHWAMCIVDVYPLAQDINLDRHSMYLSLEEPFTQTRLTALAEPASAAEYVAWSSSNTDVVTVDGGLLTAQGEGTATITVSIVNGPSDSCIVRVEPTFDTLVVPDGTTTLGVSALEHTAAEAVVLPQGLVTIGSRALAANAGLRFVLLPDGVTSIAQDAFADDPYLTLVVGANRDMSAFDVPYVTNEDASIVTARALTLPKTLTVYSGEQKTLTPTFTPANTTNQGVVWTSSNPLIATVNAAGVVTGVDIGTARITATTVDGTNLSASTAVTVALPQVVVTAASQQITPSDNEASISATLNVTGVPTLYSVEMIGVEIYDIADTLLGRSFGDWNSVNLNASAVTGAALTPSTVYGVRYIAIVGGYTFRSERTDFTTEDPIPRIVLNTDSLMLGLGQSAQLTASILNHDPDDIIWRTSNSSVASVIDGQVTGTKAGTATITARLANDTSIYATCTVTVQ